MHTDLHSDVTCVGVKLDSLCPLSEQVGNIHAKLKTLNSLQGAIAALHAVCALSLGHNKDVRQKETS